MKIFRVKNYKGLKDLELNGLSQVNLFVGRNNVGKSSLLEALTLFASGDSTAEIRDILEYNNSGGRDSDDNGPYFYSLFNRTGFNDRIAPEIIFSDERSSVRIEVCYRKEKRTQNGNSTSHVSEYVGEKEFLSAAGKAIESVPAEKGIAIHSGESFHFIPFQGEIRVYPYNQTCIFVRPVDYFMSSNAALYDQIAMSEKENQLIDALRIIEPQIQRINYLESEPGSRKRVPFVIVGSGSERVRLSTMGDGINRILTIILSLLNCPSGGILCLDEIDNGLHFSVQKQLWEMVLSLACKLNVQIFATTHSMDCLRSFAQANAGGDALLIRLDASSNGEIVPQYYSNPKAVQLAVENQIELR